MSDGREIPTSELAARLGITPSLITKWKCRGLLPKAPAGRLGQGRGIECFWSEEAVQEVRAVMASKDDRQRASGRHKTPEA